MKKRNLFYILIILFSINLTGCEEDIPRNRPYFDTTFDATTSEPETPEVIEEKSTRPEGAIIIKPDHCACVAGKEVSVGICKAFCEENSDSTNTNKVLYFNIELTTVVTEGNLEDLQNYCSTQEGETDIASCSLEFKNQEGVVVSTIPMTLSPGQTKFEIDIGNRNIKDDHTYRFAIVENASGAKSTTAQLRLSSTIVEDKIGGPLALMPVNQYSCLFRSTIFDQRTGELIIEDVNRFHFYFIPETRPEPLSPSSLAKVNCYDMQTYGNTPISSPLLEESTGIFTVWNQTDPRFFDLNPIDPNNLKLKIHTLIEQDMERQGSTTTGSLELFYPLKWHSGFDDGDTDATNSDTNIDINVIQSIVGYYMTPFLDDTTNRAYCPKQEHYYSSSPLFKAMREVVAIDTEGLYAAKQDNVCDFILIKESLLKKIWFYIEDNQHISPTESTVANKKVQFYWPADTSSPHLKKSHQRIYTVTASSDISCGSTTAPDSGPQTGSGIRTLYPAHDKRIGCIPVLKD
ncbi:MAG: hypothetical protein HON90_15945 [Halobacteriovoraceae bacterium]|nr:hypothetical protein [Halobacteriovoraceae bacterium]